MISLKRYQQIVIDNSSRLNSKTGFVGREYWYNWKRLATNTLLLWQHPPFDSLTWRHMSISNHQPLDCLFKNILWLTPKTYYNKCVPGVPGEWLNLLTAPVLLATNLVQSCDWQPGSWKYMLSFGKITNRNYRHYDNRIYNISRNSASFYGDNSSRVSIRHELSNFYEYFREINDCML